MDNAPYLPTSEAKSSRLQSFAGGVNGSAMSSEVRPTTAPKIVSDIQTTIGTKEL
jgi:hypothetical protein